MKIHQNFEQRAKQGNLYMREFFTFKKGRKIFFFLFPILKLNI